MNDGKKMNTNALSSVLDLTNKNEEEEVVHTHVYKWSMCGGVVDLDEVDHELQSKVKRNIFYSIELFKRYWYVSVFRSDAQATTTQEKNK